MTNRAEAVHQSEVTLVVVATASEAINGSSAGILAPGCCGAFGRGNFPGGA